MICAAVGVIICVSVLAVLLSPVLHTTMMHHFHADGGPLEGGGGGDTPDRSGKPIMKLLISFAIGKWRRARHGPRQAQRIGSTPAVWFSKEKRHERGIRQYDRNG